MTTATTDLLRRQLEDRRARLSDAIALEGPDADLVRLLRQVDSALGRLGSGDLGRCLVCDEPVTDEDLQRNPLMEYCLCALTEAQQNALQHDLELARRIQAGLLPDPDLAASGWEAAYRYDPAGFVSGDYCDLWVSPDEPDTVYFAVGDVSGKGVAASLLMAHLQAAFRSLAGKGIALGDLVARVNRQLLQVSLPSHYATLAFGRASAAGDIELVNAGHCPPLVGRAGEVTSVGATGFPIGLVSERPWEVTSFRLEPGESLLLYTDGFSEARRSDGEEYGPERIEQWFSRSDAAAPPRQLVRELHHDVDGFVGDAPRSDDRTVMIMRRSAKGSRAA